VLDDCKLPYNSFELVLDKTAEITYFLDAKLLFDIHLQKDQIPDPIGFVICNL
jgi:hypothetical protein